MSEKIIQSDQHKDKPSEEALARAREWVDELLERGEKRTGQQQREAEAALRGLARLCIALAARRRKA